MPILVTCLNCAKQMQAPNDAAGKKVRCPKCQTMNLVSRSGGAGEEQAIKKKAPPPKPPQEEQTAISETPPAKKKTWKEKATESVERLRRTQGWVEAHRGRLILTLGIVSIVLAGPIGLVLGCFAIYMADADRAKIEEGEMDPSGLGKVAAGRTCGLIGAIVSFVYLMTVGVVAYIFWS